MNKIKNMRAQATLILGGIFILGIIIGYIASNNKQTNSLKTHQLQPTTRNPLQINDDTITFNTHALATRTSLPQLFAPKGEKFNNSFFYQSSIDGNYFRLDLMSSGGLSEMYWHRATAIYQMYEDNNDFPTYKLVLVSPEAQHKAGFPETTIVSNDPYTIRFHYDVASPLESDGYGSRAFWADHYEWNIKAQKFINTNYKFGDFYKELLDEYESIDKAGCDSTSNKGATPMTLTELYTLNDTAYCDYRVATMTNREELERFIEYKHKIEGIVNTARP